MIPFAVRIEGVTKEGQAQWALAVTRDELLTANEDGRLAWYPLAQCRFAKLVSPEAPHPVVIVQPLRMPPNGIALPNRALRQRLEREGEGA